MTKKNLFPQLSTPLQRTVVGSPLIENHGLSPSQWGYCPPSYPTGGAPVYGGTGSDTFNLGWGNNPVYGQWGNDVFNIRPGYGGATYGGAGNDTFNIGW